jgi:hypothetical protein
VATHRTALVRTPASALTQLGVASAFALLVLSLDWQRSEIWVTLAVFVALLVVTRLLAARDQTVQT